VEGGSDVQSFQLIATLKLFPINKDSSYQNSTRPFLSIILCQTQKVEVFSILELLRGHLARKEEDIVTFASFTSPSVAAAPELRTC
jgi:hypothetical protein